MPILPNQLDPAIIFTSVLPTVSGQIPTWNEDLNEYLPQVPFTNELLGKPLGALHPTVSGQTLIWDANVWKSASTNSMNGPLIKRAFLTARLRLEVTTPKTFQALPGMSITMPCEEGDVLELNGFINIINEWTSTPFFAYTVDNGTKIPLTIISHNQGWWYSVPIMHHITNLAPGNHTIQIWGSTDGYTYVECGTNTWYAQPGPITQFSVERIKAQT